MKKKIEKLLNEKVHTNTLPEFEAGDKVRVTTREEIGGQMRTRRFEGICIARSGDGPNETAKIRKTSFGVGVERIFPLQSPIIESIEIVRKGKVRRAKLNYLEGRSTRDARIKERRIDSDEVNRVESEDTETPPDEVTDDETDSRPPSDEGTESSVEEAAASTSEGDEPAGEDELSDDSTEDAPDESSAESRTEESVSS